jgi:prepilin peptidase CpaA
MSNNDMPAVDVATVTGLAVLAVTLIIAVYRELREGRIPNWVTLSGMAIGLILGYLPGGIPLRSSIVGLLIGFGFLFIFYVFGGVGGGDVKLMGAAGALLGADLIQSALFFTAFTGAIMALLALIWSRNFRTGLEGMVKRFVLLRTSEPASPAEQVSPVTVPYGVAIAVGCLVALYMR